MELSTDLHCLFTAEVTAEADDDTYTLTIPAHEVEHGMIETGEPYRIAILSSAPRTSDTADQADVQTPERQASNRERSPPVSKGETREVEIESLGDQGDGIAKVERGFVVIVPETDVGERVTVEITDVGPNVAFGEVLKRHHDI